MPPFEDHFGGHAAAYAAYRPSYPDTVYAWVAAHAPATTAVWDCGTGSGQAAVGLARHFDRVLATDGSADQIAHAVPDPRVTYTCAPAEHSGLPDACVDAVTVAEALHWFDHTAFYDEVRRVVRPGGLIACWGYHGTVISPEVDAVITGFRVEVAPYWPSRRTFLEADYTTVPWPFEGVEAPQVAMARTWDAGAMLAYLETWSSVKRMAAETGRDVVGETAARLRAAWGEETREVVWPLCWRVGRVA